MDEVIFQRLYDRIIKLIRIKYIRLPLLTILCLEMILMVMFLLFSVNYIVRAPLERAFSPLSEQINNQAYDFLIVRFTTQYQSPTSTSILGSIASFIQPHHIFGQTLIASKRTDLTDDILDLKTSTNIYTQLLNIPTLSDNSTSLNTSQTTPSPSLSSSSNSSFTVDPPSNTSSLSLDTHSLNDPVHLFPPVSYGGTSWFGKLLYHLGLKQYVSYMMILKAFAREKLSNMLIWLDSLNIPLLSHNSNIPALDREGEKAIQMLSSIQETLQHSTHTAPFISLLREKLSSASFPFSLLRSLFTQREEKEKEKEIYSHTHHSAALFRVSLFPQTLQNIQTQNNNTQNNNTQINNNQTNNNTQNNNNNNTAHNNNTTPLLFTASSVFPPHSLFESEYAATVLVCTVPVSLADILLQQPLLTSAAEAIPFYTDSVLTQPYYYADTWSVNNIYANTEDKHREDINISHINILDTNKSSTNISNPNTTETSYKGEIAVEHIPFTADTHQILLSSTLVHGLTRTQLRSVSYTANMTAHSSNITDNKSNSPSNKSNISSENTNSTQNNHPHSLSASFFSHLSSLFSQIYSLIKDILNVFSEHFSLLLFLYVYIFIRKSIVTLSVFISNRLLARFEMTSQLLALLLRTLPPLSLTLPIPPFVSHSLSIPSSLIVLLVHSACASAFSLGLSILTRSLLSRYTADSLYISFTPKERKITNALIRFLKFIRNIVTFRKKERKTEEENHTRPYLMYPFYAVFHHKNYPSSEIPAALFQPPPDTSDHYNFTNTKLHTEITQFSFNTHAFPHMVPFTRASVFPSFRMAHYLEIMSLFLLSSSHAADLYAFFSFLILSIFHCAVFITPLISSYLMNDLLMCVLVLAFTFVFVAVEKAPHTPHRQN